MAREYPSIRAKNKESAKPAVFDLDSAARLPRILRVLLKTRVLRIGVTVCAVAAVLALSIVPATHLHRSVSGRPLVHSHLVNDPVEHAGTLDHGDHHAVGTFAPVFVGERILNAVPALTPVARAVLARPETRSLAYSDALGAPVIHGPPGRIISLRAPPA
jgi:hypothetical protein